MRLDLTPLLGLREGEEPFELEVPADRLLTSPGAFTFPKPLRFTGSVEKTPGKLVLRLRLEGVAQAPCDRCLRMVEFPVACQTEETLEESAAEGHFLDLTEPMAAALLAQLPMKVLCREDCKGLCPVCGKDLNTGACNCRTGELDPRFDDLRAFFKLDQEV